MAVQHGYGKLLGFTDRMDSFPDPLGVGSPVSLALVVLAEFVCAILVVLGLWTRAATIPLVITMGVAAFVQHGGDPMGDKEPSLMYLMMYLAIFLLGSGRYSIDRLRFQ